MISAPEMLNALSQAKSMASGRRKPGKVTVSGLLSKESLKKLRKIARKNKDGVVIKTKRR